MWNAILTESSGVCEDEAWNLPRAAYCLVVALVTTIRNLPVLQMALKIKATERLTACEGGLCYLQLADCSFTFQFSQTDTAVTSPCPVLWNGIMQLLRSMAAGPAALEIEPPPFPSTFIPSFRI